MKAMKKILAVLLTLTLVAALIPAAFADDTPADPLASTPVDVSEHTFIAYQIFSGSQSTDHGALADVEWGDGVDGDALLADLVEEADFADCESAADVAAVVAGYGNNSAEAKAFAKFVSDYLTDVYNEVADGDTVEAGYYLIVDTTVVDEEHDALNLSLLQVSSIITIASKNSYPSMQKKVDDKNDSNTSEDATNWQDSADYDIGDNVPFQLSTKVCANYDEYTEYTLIFHDTECDGLSFNNDAKVSVDGVEITSGFTVVTTGLTDGCTFEVRFADLKDITSIEAGSLITVEYTSELTEDAQIGSEGNPNVASMEFSNKPGDEGTGKTPDDKVIVFTYKVVANKVDQDKEPLVGASFALYKKIPNYSADVNEELVNAGLTEAESKNWKLLGEVSGTNSTTFEWSGIDDGTYMIVETVTPAGYNSIEPIEFDVTAEHDVDSPSPTLTKLNEKVSEDDLFIGEVDTGAVTGIIENKSGSILPSTGGIGTTLFYVFGSILVIGAGVLLVSKKRMGAAE